VIDSGDRKGGRFLGAVLERLKGALPRLKDIQSLAAWELESIVRELNLSQAELDALAIAPASALEALSRRLSHAGLSEDALAATHGDVLRDLRQTCSRCKSRARCARDLRHERRATPAKYCPNEQTLRALAFEAQQARVLPFPALRH
jgi:hypothetical protein